MLYFLKILICCLIWHCIFSFSVKSFSFIKRGVSFQMLGCIFVTGLCIVLWKPSTMFFVLAILSYICWCSIVLWGRWVQNYASLKTIATTTTITMHHCIGCIYRVHIYEDKMYIIMRVLHQIEMKTKLSNQTVNPLFFLLFMAKLPYNQLVIWQKCLWQRLLGKNTRHILSYNCS